MSFHSKGVATLVVFNDNAISTLNIVHTKDDDEVTLKKLGKETSQESMTVKEELKSYQDYLVMTADMQIYKIIVNIIFATPDLRTKVILRPIFEKNELNNMAGLENILSEPSAKNRTTKAWTELVIKPTLLIMQFTQAVHGPDYALLTATMNKVLPCFSPAHKHNYARYGLFFCHSLTYLPNEVEQQFLRGEHILHNSDGLWNDIP